MKTLSIAAGAAVAAAAYYYFSRRRASEAVKVRVLPDKQQVGLAAATFVANKILTIVEKKGAARVIVATGASQFEFLAALIKVPSMPWDKVTFFHLDEYVGLDETHGASFRKYLRERLFSKLSPPPAAVNYLDPLTAEANYGALLADGPIDLACIGIGENGHIAFNDPPVADFKDPKPVKMVELDEACRQQQLGEGWFASIADVPTHAITLTVPSIMNAACISCVVPDERKAAAVKGAVQDAISTACPATILRTHPDCTMWIDTPAASLLPDTLVKSLEGHGDLVSISNATSSFDRLVQTRSTA